MSPEQGMADPNIDSRSDIYSLGCVLYEACAGAPPFEGPTPQAVIAARFGAPPPLLDSVRKGVPSVLATAIARAMALVPEDRFTDATELATALRAAVPAVPIEPARLLGTTRVRLGIALMLLAGAFFAAGYLVATR
jgi:serine/threonine-protein kinase